MAMVIDNLSSTRRTTRNTDDGGCGGGCGVGGGEGGENRRQTNAIRGGRAQTARARALPEKLGAAARRPGGFFDYRAPAAAPTIDTRAGFRPAPRRYHRTRAGLPGPTV